MVTDADALIKIGWEAGVVMAGGGEADLVPEPGESEPVMWTTA